MDYRQCANTTYMVGSGEYFYVTLTEADAQDAGGSYFEHILLCTTSVAFGHWASLVSVSGTYGA